MMQFIPNMTTYLIDLLFDGCIGTREASFGFKWIGYLKLMAHYVCCPVVTYFY